MSADLQVSDVLAAMGGPVVVSRKLSRLIGQIVPESTVGTWKRKGNIPPYWRFVMRSYAAELGLKGNTIPQCLQPTVDW